MIILIRRGNVFAPEPLGEKDILISGHKISAIIEPGQFKIEGVDVQVINASEKIVVP
ncbi:unnamed protein product, partial [marine sediment metagenome]